MATNNAVDVVDVEPLLELIKDMLKFSTTTTAKGSATDHVFGNAMMRLKEKTSPSNFDQLQKGIDEISCKIRCICTGGEQDSMALEKTLSIYSLDSKVVMVMAAFAKTFGGFFILVGEKNKSKHLEMLRRRVEVMVNVTECVVNLRKLPSDKSSDQAVVKTAFDCIIKSVVACVPYFFGYLSLADAYTPSEDVDLPDNILISLKGSYAQFRQLHLSSQYIEEKKTYEYYHQLKEVFTRTHTSNIEILEALFDTKHSLNKQLVEVSTQQQDCIEVLKNNNVLLLITDELDIQKEEIRILVEKYNKTEENSQYKVVCLPMGKMTKSKRDDFIEQLKQKKMQWYLVHDDYQINSAVSKYIKEEWHFNKKPILVALDAQGTVITENAFTNIRILEGNRLSSIIKTEEQLWSSEMTWGLELLLQTIVEAKNIRQWIKDNNERIICLYGGQDTEWITDFTTTAREMTNKATNIQFEMVYIGGRNIKKRVLKEKIEFIKGKNLSICWSEDAISKFWVRVESMWQSRMVITKNSIEDDEILKEIKTMLTYDCSEQKGWAMISKGSTIKVQAQGEIILKCFKQYDSLLKESSNLNKDFMEVVIDYVKTQDLAAASKVHCDRLILPVTIGRTPEEMPCKICRSTMEKFVMYSCCKDY